MICLAIKFYLVLSYKKYVNINMTVGLNSIQLIPCKGMLLYFSAINFYTNIGALCMLYGYIIDGIIN